VLTLRGSFPEPVAERRDYARKKSCVDDQTADAVNSYRAVTAGLKPPESAGLEFPRELALLLVVLVFSSFFRRILNLSPSFPSRVFFLISFLPSCLAAGVHLARF